MSYLDLYDPLPEVSQEVSGSGKHGKRPRRLSIQLSGDLHRQIKLIALEDEETINSLVIGVLRRFVAEREEQVSRLMRWHG